MDTCQPISHWLTPLLSASSREVILAILVQPYLVLINRAWGLYGRILTPLLYGKEENLKSFNVTGLPAEIDSPSFLFLSSGFLALS